MTKLGVHAILSTPAALAWAKTAPVVKSIDNLDVLRAARSDAIKIFRHYFATQDLGQPSAAAADVLSALAGYRDPHLYVEVFNEIPGGQPAPLVSFYQVAVPILHAAGVMVAGPCWSTGDYWQGDWDAFRAAGWCGFNAIDLHAYWGNQGFTQWNALRYRTYWRPGDPPIVLSEVGRDAIEGGGAGWKLSGVTAAQYAAELMAYDAEIGKDSYVLGATPFSSSPTIDWSNYDMDPISPLLVTPAYSVGPGVAAKLAQEGDVATSDELYLGNETSFTTGRKGLYVYSKGENATHFLSWTS